MDVETLLVRSEGSLAKFLNKQVLDVLKTLEPDAMRPRNLTELIMRSIQVHTMLQEADTRNVLISAMTKKEAEAFAKAIGVTKWEDVHYKLRHVKFTKMAMSRALEFFGKTFDEEPARPKKDSEEIDPKALFPHQVTTVKEINDALGKRPCKALLHMPTGSGKTRSAMRVVLLHLLQDPSSLVIWLAHNEELCEQAMFEFQRMWEKAGDRKIATYRFFGPSKVDMTRIDNGFVSASLLKMLGSARKSVTFLSDLAQKTNLVIIDEAHQATAEKFSIIINELAASKSAKLLGLSATPGRKSDSADDANVQLARFFANRKIMLNTGKENPITFLIKRGYLADPKFNTVPHVGTLSPADIQRIREKTDVPKSVLEKLSSDVARNLIIVHEIMRLAKTHKKIIVFAANVEHARSISLILSAKQYRSHYITSKTPRGIRSQILEEYLDSDDPMILCNYGILTTGFDAPKTSAVVIARPTKSYVLYAQMVGRGIRGPKAGGNRKCEVSTVLDGDIREFVNIAEIFMQWEMAWNG